ncbi:MAG: helix-turn-helix transcriptional regulator [Burkholderiales bacterium]|nr:helix-turn-helix transcriptional regulator [Burkholderiales bacterium]
MDLHLHRRDTLNVHTERSRLAPAQLARWRGLPVGWFDAGAAARDRNFVVPYPTLAMLDAGVAQARFDFGRGVRTHDLSAGAIGLFDGRPCRLCDWSCRSVRRIMIALDATGLGEAEVLAGLRQELEFRDDELAAVLRAMVHEVDAGCPNGALYAESLSMGVLLRVAQLHGRQQRERGTLSAAQLHRVDELIAEGVAGELTLTALAGAAGFSKAQFVRLFRRATGTSPHRYVLQRRLERARQLIEGSSMPLAAVAHEAGFASQSHLSSTFARAYGCTPGDARRSARR